MRLLNLNKILLATMLLTSIFGAVNSTYAQQTTEQFIPIGMSPGVSNEYSHIGNITVVDLKAKTFSMQSDTGTIKINVSPTTQIWLDRSKVKKSNIDANMDALKAGRTVEVMPSRKDENVMDWIKIESP